MTCQRFEPTTFQYNGEESTTGPLQGSKSKYQNNEPSKHQLLLDACTASKKGLIMSIFFMNFQRPHS